MHTEMLENPITMHNLTQLEQRGVRIINPDTGELACGDMGADGSNLNASLKWFNRIVIIQTSICHCKTHIIITAGGTRRSH